MQTLVFSTVPPVTMHEMQNYMFAKVPTRQDRGHAMQTHPGAPQTHPGAPLTHKGEAPLTHPAAPLTHPGAPQTHKGEAALTHKGEAALTREVPTVPKVPKAVAPTDTLFRCIFRHVYGEAEIQRTLHFPNREMDEKLKIVAYLKDNLGCLKAEKFTKDRTREVMGDLLTNRVVTVVSLYALACYYKLHIYVVNEKKRVYLEMFPGHEDTVTILQTDRGGFMLTSEGGAPQTRMGWKMVAHNKVLQGVSHYTVAALLEVAETVGYDVPTTKCKKEELYTGILAHIGDIRW